MCESWEQCAVRELEEETGITIKVLLTVCSRSRSQTLCATRGPHTTCTSARTRARTHTHTHTQRAWFAGVTNDDMTDVAANKHYITIFMTM